MANSYLARTPSSTGNRKTFTFSAWVKRSKLLDNYPIMFKQVTDASNFVQFYFDNQDRLVFYVENGSGSGYLSLQITNRKFRDVSAWYHVMVAVDTTQASADNRVKIYVNGNQETSFSTNTQINQNIDVAAINTTGLIEIGRASNNSSQHFNGYMTHVSLVDGQQLAPTVFGQTDSTSGIWKFKHPSGVTWGTNGFHLKFENSGNLGLDSSGQTNNFTVNGNLKQALDTPSNVFATLNAIQESPANNSLSNGNTTFTNDGSASGHKLRVATLGASSGKYYAEFKLPNGGSNYAWCGIISYDDFNNPDTYMGSSQNSISYGNGGTILRNDSTLSSQGQFPTIGSSTILQVAVDLDNNYIYFGIDGTYVNSGDPTSGASGTGGYSINFSAGKTYTFGVSGNNTGATWNCNFGNGYFGTTAITSAGSNGNGSLFEYDVPSGYYALNTKNINTYG
jgi:hypothetical protein